MGSFFPSAAAQSGPYDPVTKYVQLRALLSGQQLQGQQIQENELDIKAKKQKQKDQQAVTTAMQEWDGKSLDQLPHLILKHGGSADAVFSTKQEIAAHKEKLSQIAKDDATTGKTNLDALAQRNNLLLGTLQTVNQAPDEQLSQSVLAAGQDALQKGLLDPQHFQQVQQMAQAPPPQLRQQLQMYEKSLLGQKEQFDQAQKERETAAQEMTAQARQAEVNKPPAEEQEFQNYYKAFLGSKNMQASPQAEMQARNDFYKRRQNPGTVDNARSDRSYQFSARQLDDVGKPIGEAISRLGRLQDTIAQNSPQADALVAPELLTVMAGGQGSGLRMNEAEIARIIGGRTNWESIKAAVNKWQTDPSKGLSITPAQRQQISSLVNEVHGKLLAKQNTIEYARDQLVNADNPLEHRRIVAGAKKRLAEIDEGKAGNATNGHPLDRFWRQ